MKAGFTLIELLITIAIIITIGAMVAPFAGSFYQRTLHESTLNNLVTALHRTQSLSLDGKSDATWGICQTENKIRVYAGTCNNPTIKEETNIPTSLTLSGLTDTTFSKILGKPSSPLTITLTSNIKSTTITLNSIGVVNVN